ncbi:MAG TPA: DUF1643 domain-containing protein [Gammaproteobacteria bacterium]|nr:DUF1643 domain-containing protein [Gammaproteobacteria bacterium]
MTQREILPPAIECIFSPCRLFRYTWELVWDPSRPLCVFCGLNPSTADENSPDPTVRRCIAFAKAWGYGGLLMLNLFAFRATEPRDMKATADPIGPDNNYWLRSSARRVVDTGGLIVAAWGAHGKFMNRADDVATLLLVMEGVPLHYLKLTKGGEPGHPLYLKGDLTPKRWG